jgi:hypothetical protein
VPEEQEHAYDDPDISSKEFLRAIMHDRTLPLGMRLDAAYKLAPLELPPVPTYYGEVPVSHVVGAALGPWQVIIRIAPIADGNGSDSDSPGARGANVGFGPREETAP